MSVTELSQLLLIDEATIKSQILPSLEAISAPAPLRAHLESLIGFSPEARAFTSAFVKNRFSSKPTPSAPSSRPPSAPQSRAHTPPPRPSSSSAHSKPVPSSSNTQRKPAPAGPKPVDFPTRQNKKAPLQLKDEQVLSLMDPLSKKELREIERGLKMLSSSSENVEGQLCFCQARKHTLSRYTRMCPKCALILCSLNSPAQPCPSCSYSPLLAPSLLSQYRLQESQRRLNLIERERARLLVLWEEQEAEAAREKFPTLTTMAGRTAAGGMADEVAKRIQNAYNGQQPQERKVLSLNMKTRQVVATTTSKEKGKKKEDGKQKENLPDVGQQKEEQEEVLEPWIDEDDIGYIERSKGKKKASAKKDSFALVYIPLTVAEAKARAAKLKEEEGEDQAAKVKVKVPGQK